MFRELPPTAGLAPHLRDLARLSGSDDLEGALAAFLGVPEVQLESSASACLIIALEYLKSRTGRRTVIVPGYTCPTVVLAAHQAACRVIACDTVANGFDLDLDHLDTLLGPDTLCVVPTHYGGALTDAARIQAFVQGRSPETFIIEDAAQAFGARWDNAPVGTRGHIGIYSFGVGKGFTIFKGGGLIAGDPEVRAGLRAASRRIVPPSAALEARRIVELIVYHLVYNPAGLAFVYGAPRRFWLERGRIERAIGDEHSGKIALHPVGRFRRQVGVNSLSRLPAHIEDAERRRRALAAALDRRGGRTRPYVGEGQPNGLFLFAMTRSSADLDEILASAWTSPFGITKLFNSSIGAYETLKPILLPSATPNAERLAATTLTVTTSGFMTGKEIAAAAEAIA
jgi:perosamine synthetase